MSKLKNNSDPIRAPFFGWGRKKEEPAGGDKLPDIWIGSVGSSSQKRGVEGFKGIDSIVVSQVIGLENPQGKPGEIYAQPLNPYFKCIPMPGEHVLVVKGDKGRFFYSDVVNLNGKLGENIDSKRASILADGSDFFFGLFGKPRETKKMDPTEGDVILEGRAGQTIRFTSTSEESFLGKLFGGKSENKPVIMISCNDDEEEGLGNEDIIEDDCSIYLASETPITTLQLESKIHKDYAKVNEYADGQIIMRSNRLVLSSKKENIILASADKLGISTKKWVVDFDELMDVIQNIQKELDQLTKGSATYTTGVGPTGPSSNAGLVAKIGSAIKKLQA
jgi:hypothetical protein